MKTKKIGKRIHGVLNGGETEIRTPGSDKATQPFQGCTIDHSDTSPWEGLYKTNIQKTAFDTTYDTTC